MKRVLLIAPEFPPPTTIAGLIPARLAAHLPAAGWDVDVVRQGSFGQTPKPGPQAARRKRPRPGRREPFQDWLPLGDAVFSVPQLVRDALAAHKSCPADAILASSAPVAASVAGDMVARRTGLPVVHMHGDPWGPCSQRGPARPFWTRAIEGRVERRINRNAAALILNTETARADYLSAFPFLSDSQVHTLRSPSDPESLQGEEAPRFDAPTLLFPGSFTARVPVEPIFALARGLGAEAGVRIALTDDPGPIPNETAAPIDIIGRVPQAAMMSLMAEADLLLAIAQPTAQRIPLKLSDYLSAERPVLVIEQAPHPELRAWVAEANLGAVFAVSEMAQAADWIRAHLSHGRHPTQPRNSTVVTALSAETSAARVAHILEEALARPHD